MNAIQSSPNCDPRQRQLTEVVLRVVAVPAVHMVIPDQINQVRIIPVLRTALGRGGLACPQYAGSGEPGSQQPGPPDQPTPRKPLRIQLLLGHGRIGPLGNLLLRRHGGIPSLC
ncbi:hypothetical protein [Kribbella qitaiheensis]|uniref:hypothetical protein n=1 Tax=Kribbella qitaiheensis TaxID=1544730 RepID=UPI001FEB4557|nr:hypothetical protein [Kribbella qitaiheensis]